MDIGEEEETTVIEPVEDPVPARRESPEPKPERVEPEPEREKVANLATSSWPSGQVSGGAMTLPRVCIVVTPLLGRRAARTRARAATAS
jgi:hypothetical protein